MPSHRDRSRSRSPRKRNDEYDRPSRSIHHDYTRWKRSYSPSGRDHRTRYRKDRDDRDDDRHGSSSSHRGHSERKERHRREGVDRPKDKKRRYDSESEDDFLDLTSMGVNKITEDDYFLKSAEFKHWLKADRAKYIDELSSSEAHRYFRKFVRRWNDGALERAYYRPPRSSSNTAYKWSFSSPRRSRTPSPRRSPSPPSPNPITSTLPNPDAHSNALSDSDSDPDIGPSLPRSSHPIAGPSRPSASDRQLAREEAHDMARYQRKSDRREAYDRADELVPKAVGKEGKLAEKRAGNAVNKEMREKDVGGLEVDEGTLMGEGSSFQAALRARDTAQGWRAEKKQEEYANRRAEMDDRMAERKHKEAATMDMLKAMAKQRFG